MSERIALLIVDDCEADRELYRRLLSEDNSRCFEFLEAETLDAGRTLLASASAPDCVLLDYRLPDGEGVELLEELAGRPGTPPVILLTGLGNEAVAVEAMRQGASGYVPKGTITASALIMEVGSALDNARVARELAATEAELRRLNERNRLVLDTVAEGILGLDRDGIVIFANPAAGAYLSDDPSKIIGRPAHAVVHEASRADHSSATCPIAAPARHPQGQSLSEDVFVRADGTSFPVEYSASPMVDTNGRLAGGVVAFRDVTEHRSLQQQLHQAQKLESVGRLASGIAHEVNTPTQFVSDNVDFLQQAFADLSHAMKTYSELLGSPEVESAGGPLVARWRAEIEAADLGYVLEEIPRALEQSQEGLLRISEIVTAMRDFAHPSSPEMAAVDLNRAIQSTLTVARSEWKYLAELETDFDPELPPVTCVAGELNQAVLNMVVNAAHAIAEVTDGGARGKGRISVRTRRDREFAVIEIADTGPGIPEAVRSLIFDPFFTTKEVGRGTGQGLAISRSVVVDKHGGTIDCETSMGTGTKFIIRLPLQESATAVPGVLE